ncbi:Uncharacterised protein [Chlamydia trachomatis]|nr:Uncharacterised protein [Chlamydia trachomatis]
MFVVVVGAVVVVVSFVATVVASLGVAVLATVSFSEEVLSVKGASLLTTDGVASVVVTVSVVASGVAVESLDSAAGASTRFATGAVLVAGVSSASTRLVEANTAANIVKSMVLF